MSRLHSLISSGASVRSRLLPVVLACLAAAAVRAEERFFLSEPGTGTEFGPFAFTDGAVIEINGRSLKIRRPDSPAKALEQRMKQIVIPTIEFRNAALSDVLEFLVAASIAGDPEATGTSILLSPDPKPGEAREAAPAMPGRRPPQTITLSLRRISLYDAVFVVAESAGLTVRLSEHGVVFLDRGMPVAP